MESVRTELPSMVLAAFVALVVTFGVGRAAQLGVAHHEGRLTTVFD